jgi:hypothetical protein
MAVLTTMPLTSRGGIERNSFELTPSKNRAMNTASLMRKQAQVTTTWQFCSHNVKEEGHDNYLR